MIRALIFDLDGTLVNTELLHYQAWEQTLLANGLSEFSLTTFLGYVGSSNEKVAADHVDSHGIEKTVEELVREKQQRYLDFIPRIPLCAGVREVLERFHGKKKLAVASSSHLLEVGMILRHLQLSTYFDELICGDMVANRKPHPESYLTGCLRLNLAPDQCVAFEDSAPGLQAAKNGGLFGVAIPNEFTRTHDFSRADCVIDSLAEVDETMLARFR